VYLLQAKDELEEHLAYQEEQTQKVRALIENHEEAIDSIYGKLYPAKGTISKLQQVFEEAKKESRERLLH